MKSILYVGATLMIGASIYGFVDYKKTQHKKEFTGMYEGENKKEPVIVADNKTTDPVVKKDAVITEKKVATTGKKDATQSINDKEVASTNKIKEIDNPEPDVNVPADNKVEKKVVRKKRRLSAELFSRAPIREEELELPAPVKTEVKKPEIKEQ